MQRIEFTINGTDYIGFEAAGFEETVGRFRDLLDEALSFTPGTGTVAGRRNGMVGINPTLEAQPATAAPPQDSTRLAPAASPKPSRPVLFHRSTSSRGGAAGRGDNSGASGPIIPAKRRANNGLNVWVLEALAKLGEAEISEILAHLEEAGRSIDGDDPDRAVSGALYYERSKNTVERVEGKRGTWRLVK